MAGVVFILLTLISRGVPSQQGFTSAIAPRYILGTFLFTVGILVILSKFVKGRRKQMAFNVFLYLVILSVFTSGMKTGSEWLSVRRNQTSMLAQCLNSSSKVDLLPGGKCFILGQTVRNPVNDQLFSEQLQNFKRNGY